MGGEHPRSSRRGENDDVCREASLERRDPRAGADYLVQITQTNETRDALMWTVVNWAERDLEGAFAWAAGLDDAALGDWVAGAVTGKLPQDRRATAKERWRALRNTTPGKQSER